VLQIQNAKQIEKGSESRKPRFFLKGIKNALGFAGGHRAKNAGAIPALPL
jgi:hypothetical protein